MRLQDIERVAVNRSAKRRAAVGYDENMIIAVKSRTRGGVDTAIGADPGDDQRIDAARPAAARPDR